MSLFNSQKILIFDTVCDVPQLASLRCPNGVNEASFNECVKQSMISMSNGKMDDSMGSVKMLITNIPEGVNIETQVVDKKTKLVTISCSLYHVSCTKAGNGSGCFLMYGRVVVATSEHSRFAFYVYVGAGSHNTPGDSKKHPYNFKDHHSSFFSFASNCQETYIFTNVPLPKHGLVAIPFDFTSIVQQLFTRAPPSQQEIYAAAEATRKEDERAKAAAQTEKFYGKADSKTADETVSIPATSSAPVTNSNNSKLNRNQNGRRAPRKSNSNDDEC